MSKKKIQKCCLVIDASMAAAAGSLEARHPTATRCRDFLIAVKGIGHRMAWSQAVKAEWDAHQSLFAMQWRVTMMNLKKLRPVQDENLEELRKAIKGHSDDQNVVAKMLKDAHLIEAALATDRRIASGDRNARGHFGRLATTLDSRQRLNWVDPVIKGEQAVKWLETGARLERARRLRP